MQTALTVKRANSFQINALATTKKDSQRDTKATIYQQF